MSNNPTQKLPQKADVVIIGGGIIGCALAYHLAEAGRQAVLLERKQLTCGTTWHAAGLVGTLRNTKVMCEIANYGLEHIKNLADLTGQETGFKQNGSLSLATNSERLEEFHRIASVTRRNGHDVQTLTAEEISERFPYVNTSDVCGGLFNPSDGQTNPIDTTNAYAKGAKSFGAVIAENTKATKLVQKNGKITHVETSNGTIETPAVIIAAGMWTRELAQTIGVHVPLHAAEHFYIVTEPIPNLDKNFPVIRDPDNYAYYKEDAGKVLLGAFEPIAKPWGMQGIPEDFCFDTLAEDFDHFSVVFEPALERLPLLETAGIQLFFNGPESFTPDDKFHIGATPEVEGVYIAAGLNSIGIQSSPAIAKILTEWIVNGYSSYDINGFDVLRNQDFQSVANYLHDRTTESLGLLYQMHWPFRQVETARNVRRSPFYDRLHKAKAVYGEVAGWERPNWFAEDSQTPQYEYSYGKQNWFANCQKECLATRDKVALYDQSSFAKFLVAGKSACKLLNHLSCNDIDTPCGKVVYTQFLNERGNIESDLTITRLGECEFLVVTGAAVQKRDFSWIKRHIQLLTDGDVTITDITSGLSMLGLMGANSRALLEKLSGEDLSHTAFPFGTSRELEIGYARVRASRLTFVGELGWELYIPTEFALGVFDEICSAGKDFGLSFAGMHALNACRLEKGYRHWGHDISDVENPIEAGLSFTCKMDKPDFIGKDSLLRIRTALDGKAPSRRLVQFYIDAQDAPLMYHEEPLLVDGRYVGGVTSGMWGHRINKSIGMGYMHTEGEPLTQAFLDSANLQVEVALKTYPLRAQFKPLYDPTGERIKS